MARKSATDEVVLQDTPMTVEEWTAQEPCPECGGRPGQHPESGVRLRIRLPSGDWCEGHTYNCAKRPQ